VFKATLLREEKFHSNRKYRTNITRFNLNVAFPIIRNYSFSFNSFLNVKPNACLPTRLNSSKPNWQLGWVELSLTDMWWAYDSLTTTADDRRPIWRFQTCLESDGSRESVRVISSQSARSRSRDVTAVRTREPQTLL